MHTTLVSMVLPGVPPPPHAHIGTKFSHHILAPKLLCVTFSLRPEEALLVLTLQKLVSLEILYSVLL